MNAPALAWCRRYRLPCADASAYAGDTGNLKRIGWAKFKMTRDLLKKGFHVHLSDLDVAYLKPVAPAVEEVFSWSNGAADGSMMQEEWVYQDNPDSTTSRRPIYLANTGVVWLKANARSVGFMESLLRFEGDSYQDQYIATHVAYQAWAPCQEEATCLSVASRGMAAVTRHPAQFAHDNCEPEPRYDHCASRRLYVHAICRALNTDKESFLRSVKAMFIRAAEPGAGNSGGGRLQDDPAAFGQHDVEVAAASGLPCPARQQRAWSAHFYSAYTTQGSAVGAGVGTDAAGEGVIGTGAGAAAATAAASAGAGALAGSGSGAGSEIVGRDAVAAHMDAESAKVRAQALSERTGGGGGRPAHHSRKAHQRPHRHLMRLRS
ncbi:hypothetical protein HYH02_008561 [Chlamydomonas schloesseri]|uniref:Nucleotide-diphospho-sugar transferase domain-containing protein n=1 Tax=Chlamydomonas schloesseri TaxID=2026947 RepID=A0A835WFP0_9CHLO|nr:hypothetical protein HYH02_008561 [Chlamydomonas schloesseri]|eukprot:KAG2446575.1 hypothetical protein HYH02_008561 [Chlamydomonas schloesseri]